ncbi:MAG: hypothetical protein ACI8QC_004508 [Planctomycetota bacterium]|jgi:hypothetical protein
MTDEPELTAADLPLPGGDFRMFVTRLSFQGLLSCGVLENPVTNSRQVNMPNAYLVQGDLEMLQRKTSGNLDGEEKAHLDKVVSDLQTIIEKVEAAKFTAEKQAQEQAE